MSVLPRAKKVSVDIPNELYAEAESVMKERHLNTSALVREAIDYYLRSIRDRKLEEALREGYLANAELDRQICAEFALVDAEIP